MSDCVCQSESDLRTYLFSRVPEPLTHYSRKRKSGFFCLFTPEDLLKSFLGRYILIACFSAKKKSKLYLFTQKNCSKQRVHWTPFSFLPFFLCSRQVIPTVVVVLQYWRRRRKRITSKPSLWKEALASLPWFSTLVSPPPKTTLPNFYLLVE